jgi:flagellar basal-body rod protein FlgC
MISPLNSAISALQAHVKKLGVTAHNIANVNTEGYKKYRATMEEDALGGVRVDIRRVETPGHPYEILEEGQPVTQETSNVDLTQEIPDLMIARRGYEANIKTIQAEEKILGSLLDIVT